MSVRAGKVRPARITDFAALGELSRLAQRDAADARSLGLPVAGPPIGVFSLFRFPLGAFTAHDLIFVFDEDGHVGGLLRVERDPARDEWTIVELDAVGAGEAGDIRFRLVQHLLRDAARRGAARLHVACADDNGNVPLFMQAGFARYGEEIILFRPADAPHVPVPTDARARADRIRPAGPTDAVALFRLNRLATPAPVARLEMLAISDWSGSGSGSAWRVPRSSLTPILRFAAVEVFVQDAVDGGPDGTGLDGFVQVGVAQEDQPHYLRVSVRPEADPGALIRYGLGTIAERSAKSRSGRERGVMTPVRTYESPLEHRFEEAGFTQVATVTLLVKETLVRVAEPALVPAIG
jgi:hypothetical protein